MKWMTTLMTLMMATVLLAGCGGSSNSDESSLRGRYRELERNVENRDLSVMELFDPDYLDSGYDYTDARNDFAGFYDRYRNIDMHTSLLDIRVNGNFADVHVREWFEADDTYDNNRRVQSDEYEYVDVWKYEFGDWFLWGNQQADAGLKPKPRLFNKERPVKPIPKDG